MVRRGLSLRRWRKPVLLGSVVLLWILLGCANREQRYRVLSIFFDGVPDPNAPAKTSLTQKAGRRQTFVHKPYQDNQCNSCHQNSADIFARAQVRADVCLDCHANATTQYPIMHGPVVNNACQMCHSPHSSANKHLLRQPAPALCTQCHEPSTMQLMHKQPLDPKASCVECHSGHGGSDHRLLLAERPQLPATTTQPTTRESQVRR